MSAAAGEDHCVDGNTPLRCLLQLLCYDLTGAHQQRHDQLFKALAGKGYGNLGVRQGNFSFNTVVLAERVLDVHCQLPQHFFLAGGGRCVAFPLLQLGADVIIQKLGEDTATDLRISILIEQLALPGRI